MLTFFSEITPRVVDNFDKGHFRERGIFKESQRETSPFLGLSIAYIRLCAKLLCCVLFQCFGKVKN